MHSFCKCNELQNELTVIRKSVLDLICKGCDLITCICIEQITLFRLLIVNVCKLVLEHLRTEQMTQTINTFLVNEPALLLACGVQHKVHMRMMGLIVKCSVPFQRSEWDAVFLCNKIYLTSCKLTPAFCGVVTKALCIFTFERNDYRKHVTVKLTQSVRLFIKIQRNIVIGKQSVCSFDPFHTRTSCNIVKIGFVT